MRVDVREGVDVDDIKAIERPHPYPPPLYLHLLYLSCLDLIDFPGKKNTSNRINFGESM